MKYAIFTAKSSVVCAALLVAFSLTAISCKSTPTAIPADRTAAELIQDGQNYYSTGNYTESLRYYQEVINRFGDDTATYIEARYEIAHLYMKQKKYSKAKPILEEIKKIFSNTEPGTLPAAYDKLAQIELDKIPTAEGKKEKTEPAATAASTQEEAPDTY